MVTGNRVPIDNIITRPWMETTLGEFVSLRRGHDLTGNQRSEGSVPVMGAAGQNGWHDTAIKEGPGVVLGRSGASYGQVHFCEDDYWPHNTALYVTDFHDNDPLFAYYFLKALDFSRFNSGGAQPSLNRNFIYPIEIRVPAEVAEQWAIAEALSDVDALLNALDALITKKRHIKQGTMQQLLTGNKRLNGFHEDWKDETLGEMFDISAGGDLNKLCFSPFKTGRCCHPIFANGITGGGLYGFSSEYRHEADAITVTARGTLGVANYRPTAFDAIGRLLVLRPRRRTDCFFATEYINNRIAFVVESTGVPQLTAPQIADYSIQCPGYDEQSEIATVLSDMDREIASLEQNRDKTKLIKQGMMQELLTGKTRLV